MLRRFYSKAMTNTIVLREYQSEAIEKVLLSLKKGIKRPAVVLATGGGKTVVMSHLIPKIEGPSTRKKTLVLAHKEELVRQIAQTLCHVNPELEIAIDMQKLKPTPTADIVVGSVPTLTRLTRLHMYKPEEYKAIVIDECHHATATSWMKILNYFGALEEDLELVTLGFTATLERSDGMSLGKVFQEIAYERNLLTMIEQKELCDARFLSIKLDMSLAKMPLYAGDYKRTELDKRLNTNKVNLQLACAYKEVKKQLGLKSTLVFCVSVEHCKTLCGVLQAQGVNAQYVYGETVKHERRAILEDFKSGKIEVLCNVLVFTEGTDIPNIDSLILARPTKSRPLLTQMIGRGLRLHHGKEHCHIIDMVDAASVGILSVPILFGLPPTYDINKKSFRELEQKKAELDEHAEAQIAKDRDNHIQKLLLYSHREKDWDVKLEERGGFAEMLRLQQEETPVIKDCNLELISGNWARLEYTVWGTSSWNKNRHWILELNENSDEGKFSLYTLEVASREQIFSSNFKCPRTQKKLINQGELKYLLAIVGKNKSKFTRYDIQNKPASEKQVELLFDKYSPKVRTLFGESALETFRTNLNQFKQKHVTLMLVAGDYSMSCWYMYKTLKGLVHGKPQGLKTDDGIASNFKNLSLGE